ncbi:MAG: M14 family metallopeptidase [Steroidobacteraceae bacterium]
MRAPLLAIALSMAVGVAPADASAKDPLPQIAPLPFDHIMKYDELTQLLHAWQTARPALMRMESIGATPEQRPIWFLTLTNQQTGPANAKPALLVDGNMHATEWAGGVAALHFTWRLLRDYGTDERVTRLLDTRVVYVLPRMTPDGVDATLTQGRFIRSVHRPYPNERGEPGIHPSDVDRDGRALFMRIRDPNGAWKQSAADRRLLVPRAPDESGGDYWRVLPEGMIEAYDGASIADPPSREPLDFGANFPGDRGSAPSSASAGPYPASEPEVAAVVAAVTKRPNIVAHVTCHTFGGLILTPPVNVAEKLSSADRRTYETLAAKGAQLTGYRAMSYLELRAEDRETHIPSAFGWLYERRGIYSFITELWDPLRAAGISLEGTTASAWLWGYHPLEDELKLLRFSDKELKGDGFVSWRTFDHPQLGRVEIGGFDLIRYWYNVPFHRLEKEVAPHSEWLLYLGLSTPLIAVRSFSAEPAGASLWRVRLIVENRGWLPTNGSQRALEQNVATGTTVELMLPAEAQLVGGELRRSLGQLDGRVGQRSAATWWSYTAGTPDRAVADWLVAAPAGATLKATATHPRAGTAAGQVALREGGR